MKISEHQCPLFLPWQAWVLNGFYACCLIIVCLWVEPSFHQRVNSFWLDSEEVLVNDLDFTQTFLITTQQDVELSYYLNKNKVTRDELAVKIEDIAHGFNHNSEVQPLIVLDLAPSSTISSQLELVKFIQKLDLKVVQISSD